VIREYHKWFSHNLRREMELLVFGERGDRVVVFPTRQGRFFDYENWGLTGALREQIAGGQIQLYCVDSLDSESLYGWGKHPKDRIARHNEYEAYVLQEVIPFSEWKNPGSDLVAHGCSIGAYHAVNIALRNAGLFKKVVALSGRYDLTRPAGPFPDLFNGHYDKDLHYHTPNHFLPNLSDSEMIENLRNMQIALAVGRADPFGESNRDLSQSLWDKGVWHSLDLWDGEAHCAKYWRQMVGRYF
jgi:esterase/lipase superfamily enzyme